MPRPVTLKSTTALFAPLCALAFGLAGCGGGGGGGSSSSPSPTPTTSRPSVTPAPTGAGTYAVTDIVPLPGDDQSQASGINGSGQVAGNSVRLVGCGGNGPVGCGAIGLQYRGFFFDGKIIAPLAFQTANDNLSASGLNDQGAIIGGNNHNATAFLASGGAVTPLSPLAGDNSSRAYGVNGAGQVAGASVDGGTGISRAVLYAGGSYTTLGTLPGGTYSAAIGINSAGQVVGYSGTAVGGVTHAVLYAGGKITDLGALPDAQFSEANAISDGGQIVGESAVTGATGERAVLFSGGTVTELGVLPGGSTSVAYGINQSGQTVGASDAGQGPSATRAVLWQSGKMTDLNTLIAPDAGWVMTEATGINSAGQICGNGTHNGASHAFLLTPH